MATEDYWLAAGPEQQMLLLLGRVCDEWGGPAHRRLVQTTCEFVRRAVSLLPTDDPRPRAILSIVEGWAAGDHTITRDDLGRAADFSRVVEEVRGMGDHGIDFLQEVRHDLRTVPEKVAAEVIRALEAKGVVSKGFR